MKSINYKISGATLGMLFFLFLVLACKNKEDELSLSRQFSPAKVNATNGETQVTLKWSASLFTLPGQVSYVIEISDNATDFSNPAFTATLQDVSLVITDDKLTIKKDYYARVKAIGSGDTADSNWLVSSSFRILGEQFLNAVTADNITDGAVRLNWRASSELTKLKLTPTGGTPIEINLTDADRTATMKQVDNLTQKTTYTAELFAGIKSKGTQQFNTLASIAGNNIIDLSSTTGNSAILATTIGTAPSGSVIVLRRGESYNIPSAITLTKSLTVLSKLDFGKNYATVRMGSNFNIAAGTIDSLIFKDLVIKGTQAALAANAGYLINASNAGATVTKVRLENCSLKILRGVIRGQAGGGGITYKSIFINRCLMDSLRDFGVIAASGTSIVDNISITNTTIYRARKFIIHAVTSNTSITIANCTFNELVSGTAAPATNFFVDFGASPNTQNSKNGITLTNCIFGSVWNETNAGTVIDGIRKGSSTGLTITNSYSTSDFVNNGSNPISPLTSYSGTSSQLFVDPNNGNFAIKDASFVGKSSAGDPRWR